MSLYQSIYNAALRMKTGTEHLAYGRKIIREWAVGGCRCRDGPVKILDIGCGKGNDLANIREELSVETELSGIECHGPYLAACKEKKIRAFNINVERDVFPFDHAGFDIVVANQIMEHLKELFFFVSEVSRVLKPGGLFLVGVPNLAAWHDRAILLLGRQPSGVKVLGPHVRAFTGPGLIDFIECDGYFALEDSKGSGFYPFPLKAARLLARVFPTLATAVFFKFRRTDKPGRFIEVLKTREYETNYFRGQARPDSGMPG